VSSEPPLAIIRRENVRIPRKYIENNGEVSIAPDNLVMSTECSMYVRRSHYCTILK
jgi:hypothetical protein